MSSSEQAGGSHQDGRAIAHPGRRKSFDAIAAKAREVLRERGLTDWQIERELNREKREMD